MSVTFTHTVERGTHEGRRALMLNTARSDRHVAFTNVIAYLVDGEYRPSDDDPVEVEQIAIAASVQDGAPFEPYGRLKRIAERMTPYMDELSKDGPEGESLRARRRTAGRQVASYDRKDP